MSGGFPLDFIVSNSNSIGVSAGAATTITGAAAAYGSYAELIASTPFDTSWVSLNWGVITNNLTNDFYLTIGVGGAGSEVPVMADYYIPFGQMGNITMPFQMAAGSRVAAKLYASGADTIKVSAVLFETTLKSQTGYAGLEAVAGAAPNITIGVASGTSGTYGTWGQIVASTAKDYLGLMCTITGPAGSAIGAAMYEIGVGSAGNEVPIIVDQSATAPNGVPESGFFFQIVPISIPAGTRLSFRTTVPGAVSSNFRMACTGLF